MFLQRYTGNICCLCGSSERLTGEHKIKASRLRKEFGKDTLVVGTLGEPEQRLRTAQSTNSKHLKFKVRICESCNTSRTQKPDKEFDRFHQLVLEKVNSGEDAGSIFDLEEYVRDSEPYLNIFRYFAKLLSCHLADINAPIPIILAMFAIGKVSSNCIWLEVKSDPTYRNVITKIGERGYAAHGGLVVYGDKNTFGPNAFHSTLTIGPIQYVYHMRLNEFEKMEIQIGYPDFYQWCVSKVKEARQNPIPDGSLLQLGLKDEDA